MNILFPYMARWKSINWTRYHNLFTEFAKRGHKIYIIQPPSLKSEETNFLEIDIEIHKNINLITFSEVPFWNLNIPFSKIIKKAIYSYLLSRKIEDYIRKFNIDIIFVYNIPQYFIVKKLKGKVKIIFDICDDFPEMMKYEIKIFKNFIKNLGKNYLNKLINLSNLIITSSQRLKEKYFNNAYLIPNGVDLDLLNNIEKENNKIKGIGFIGSFEYFIDFDLIFYLARNLKNVNFLLIGTGRLFEKVKEFINKNNLSNIQLYGPVSHNKIYEYLNKFDIALLPFKKNEVSEATCPLKLFEYSLFKIPVVSIDLDELKKIDKNFINFYKTKEEALNLIIDVLNNENEYIKKCENGYNLIKAKYNWKALSDKYLEIIKKELKIT